MDTNQKKNDAAFFLKTAIGLTPIGLAAYYGKKSMQKESVLHNPLPTAKTPLQNLAHDLGETAKNLNIQEKKDRLLKDEKIKAQLEKTLSSSESLTDLLRSTEKRNIIIQSLALTLDDPSLGIEDSRRSMIKQQLIDLSNTPGPDAEKVIKDVLVAIKDSSTPETARLYARLQNQYAPIAGQLSKPKSKVATSGVAFQNVEMKNLSKAERDYVFEIQKALGKDYKVEVKEYMEFGKTNRVAHVSQKFSQGQRFRTSIPLIDGNTYYRSGESGRTLYSMPARMLDATIAQRKGAAGATATELISSAGRTLPNYFINELARRNQTEGFVDWESYNSWMRSYMTNVDRLAGKANAYGHHVRMQLEAKSNNSFAISNLEALNSDQQRNLVANLGANYKQTFDAGIGSKRLLSRSDTSLMGNIGRHQGSMLQKLQEKFGWADQTVGNVINRNVVPLTLREHQIIGRTSMFLGDSKLFGERQDIVLGSVLEAARKLDTKTNGADAKALKDNLKKISIFGEKTSGGLGALFLVDVKKTGNISEGLNDLGIAYMGKRQAVGTPVQYTVLDPSTHNYLQGDALEKILAANGDFVEFSQEELRQGIYLGETANGAKMLPFNENIKGIRLALDRVSEESAAGGTKRTISLTGIQDNDYDLVKMFSFTHKGNVQYSENVIGEIDKERRAFATHILQQTGIQAEDVVLSTSDMYKKGSIGFINQVTSATRIATQGRVGIDDIRTAAFANAKAGSTTLRPHNNGNWQLLADYAQAAMEFMVKNNVDPALIGSAMAGVYHGATGSSANYGIDKSTIVTLATNLFKNDPHKMQAFMGAAEAGITFGHDIAQVGESMNAWGRGRAGVESRFVKTFHERLLSMGLSTDKASSLTTNLMKNKIGFTSHFELADQLSEMLKYAHGQSGTLDYLKRYNTMTIKSKDLIAMSMQEGSLVDLLKKTKGGVMIDFTDDDFLNSVAKDVFGGSELVLPGQEAFEASKGTLIKQAEGRSAAIDSELGQMIHSLQGRLSSMSPNSVRDSRTARSSLREWKGASSELFLRVFDQLSGGKIAGGISPTVGVYDITRGTGLGNQAIRNRATEVFMDSNFKAIFQPAEGFLSQLSDANLDVNDIANKLKTFFTSMEKGKVRNKYVGIPSIGGRHPQMTTGNVYLTETFRHLKEVSELGGEDLFLKRFRESEIGSRLLRKHFGTTDIQSFAQIGNMEKNSQKAFFRDFAQNIQHFTSGQGSDIVYYPSLKTDKGDIGIGIQAFQDADGDHSLHFLYSGKDSNEILKAQRANGNAAFETDIRIRKFFNDMVTETKSALSNIEKRHILELQKSGLATDEALKLTNKIFQDISKEVGLAMQTGPLDVSLRGIHEAFLMHETDPSKKAFARIFLGNIQENFVIKSKKLPVYTNLADRVASAAKTATTQADINPLRDLLKELFAGTNFAENGIVFDLNINALSSNSNVNTQFAEKMGQINLGGKYSLDDFLNDAERVLKTSQSEGTIGQLTTGQLSMALERDPEAAIQAILSGKTYQSGVIAGYKEGGIDEEAARMGQAAKALKENMRHIDGHFTGVLGLGILASAAVLGAMTNHTSSTSLIMPGESSNTNVNQEIANNSLFNRGDVQIPTNSIGTIGVDSQTPIIPGTMYATKQNSYQIRGEIGNIGGLMSFSNYFTNLTGNSGRGNININDQRRPITRNYVDRFLGEY